MNGTPYPRLYEEWRHNDADRSEDAANLFGYYLILHCRAKALNGLVAEADAQVRTLVEKAVDQALHNVMDLLEGFWTLKAGSESTAEFGLHVNIRQDNKTIESLPISPAKLDLPIGYWAWRDRGTQVS